MANPTRSIVVRGAASAFTQKITARKHTWTSDEPAPAGGADEGPDPYELLLGSLGACTSMTLRMYARHKGWPLESVTVTLEHDRIHAKDCESCETKEGKIDRIRRRIAVEGPLDDVQRARLIEIADRCPVHRTLVSEIAIETTLLPRPT